MITLAASAREWSDRLHRFLLDHGGGVVVVRAMTAEQAIDAEADVLLIDDICSFLTPRLVMAVRERGQAIVGVFDTDDGPDAKRRLLEVGISDVVDASAPPDEFLDVVNGAIRHLPDPGHADTGERGVGVVIGVTGAPGGVGVTEVAIGLGRSLTPGGSCVVVDFNQSWPGVGQRLGLPVYPNLRSVVDLALHEPERILDGVHEVDGLGVVSGLADPDSGGLPVTELAALVITLAERQRFVVLDLGTFEQRLVDLLSAKMDALLVVGSADPVGLTRLTRISESLSRSNGSTDIAIVVNRVSRLGRRRDEVVEHMKRVVGSRPLVLVPDDSGLERAAWDGRAAGKGAFERRMNRLARVFVEAGS